jgi:hypothetical protein
MATSVQSPPLAVARLSRATSIARTLLVTASLVLITILLQIAGSAYSSEFSGYPDEPAHVVTGLMIRDYIAEGAPGSPVAYAENYYLHYPKVAFGMWGPLLHVAEAVWMLIFPPSRTAVLVLMAMITAGTAALLFHVLFSRFGLALAAAAALLFVANPIVQRYTGMVMADGLVALLDFAAALAFGKFLQTGKWKHSVQFGAFTCLSILSKGNGVALVLLPAFAMIFSRDIGMLKNRALWIGPALIACIAGPWQLYSAMMLSGILERRAPFAFISFYTMHTAMVTGIVLLPFALAGFYDRIIRPWKERSVEGIWAAAAALIFSVMVFHCIIPAPAPDYRYLIALIPPMLMFVVAGAALAARKALIPLAASPQRYAAAGAIIAVFFATAFHIPQKPYYGYDEVATLLERKEHRNSVILVSSEGWGEGLLVSEVAMRDDRPSHIVLRAIKMLGQADWDGKRYELLYSTPEKVMEYLKSIPVDIVVIDGDRGASYAHHDLLKRTIAAFPQEWTHLGTYPQQRQGKTPIDVYRLTTASQRPRGRILIHMPFTLGRSIELDR